jgi:hypothetical protein
MVGESRYGITSGKIAAIVMYSAAFAPYLITTSGLIRVAFLQDRYIPERVRKIGCFKKFLMLLFLTSFGPFLIFLGKIVIAVGEVVVLLVYLTFSTRRVSATRAFFDRIASYLWFGIDKKTFDGV